MQGKNDGINEDDDETLHQRLRSITLLIEQDPRIGIFALFGQLRLIGALFLLLVGPAISALTTAIPKGIVGLVLRVLPSADGEIWFGNFQNAVSRYAKGYRETNYCHEAHGEGIYFKN